MTTETIDPRNETFINLMVKEHNAELAKKKPNFSVSNFPIGTVVEMQGYKVIDGEPQMRFNMEDGSEPARFTVKKVFVHNTASGRASFIEVDLKRKVKLYDDVVGDEYFVFTIKHVTNIIKLGTHHKVDYDLSFNKDLDQLKTKNITSFEATNVFREIAITLNNKREHDYANMVVAAIKTGVLRLAINKNDSRWPAFNFNKKKLKSWMKRNLNRYILSNKELVKMQLDKQNLFDGLDREFSGSHYDLEDIPGNNVIEPILISTPLAKNEGVFRMRERYFRYKS